MRDVDCGRCRTARGTGMGALDRACASFLSTASLDFGLATKKFGIRMHSGVYSVGIPVGNLVVFSRFYVKPEVHYCGAGNHPQETTKVSSNRQTVSHADPINIVWH
jgi:hypothetical protein